MSKFTIALVLLMLVCCVILQSTVANANLIQLKNKIANTFHQQEQNQQEQQHKIVNTLSSAAEEEENSFIAKYIDNFVENELKNTESSLHQEWAAATSEFGPEIGRLYRRWSLSFIKSLATGLPYSKDGEFKFPQQYEDEWDHFFEISPANDITAPGAHFVNANDIENITLFCTTMNSHPDRGIECDMGELERIIQNTKNRVV